MYEQAERTSITIMLLTGCIDLLSQQHLSSLEMSPTIPNSTPMPGYNGPINDNKIFLLMNNRHGEQALAKVTQLKTCPLAHKGSKQQPLLLLPNHHHQQDNLTKNQRNTLKRLTNFLDGKKSRRYYEERSIGPDITEPNWNTHPVC